jgi:integrase
MRLSEIRLLRREQVHLEQGVVVFPKPDGWPWSRHYVSYVIQKAARGAGLRFHDLRHHGAMALNKTYIAPIVMALGG